MTCVVLLLHFVMHKKRLSQELPPSRLLLFLLSESCFWERGVIAWDRMDMPITPALYLWMFTGWIYLFCHEKCIFALKAKTSSFTTQKKYSSRHMKYLKIFFLYWASFFEILYFFMLYVIHSYSVDYWFYLFFSNWNYGLNVRSCWMLVNPVFFIYDWATVL